MIPGITKRIKRSTKSNTVMFLPSQCLSTRAASGLFSFVFPVRCPAEVARFHGQRWIISSLCVAYYLELKFLIFEFHHQIWIQMYYLETLFPICLQNRFNIDIHSFGRFRRQLHTCLYLCKRSCYYGIRYQLAHAQISKYLLFCIFLSAV